MFISSVLNLSGFYGIVIRKKGLKSLAFVRIIVLTVKMMILKFPCNYLYLSRVLKKKLVSVTSFLHSLTCSKNIFLGGEFKKVGFLSSETMNFYLRKITK